MSSAPTAEGPLRLVGAVGVVASIGRIQQGDARHTSAGAQQTHAEPPHDPQKIREHPTTASFPRGLGASLRTRIHDLTRIEMKSRSIETEHIMPRRKAPCGTYSAYQRHLKEGVNIDSACRRAQQDHDAGSGVHRVDALTVVRPVARSPKAETVRSTTAAGRPAELRTLYAKSVVDLAYFVGNDDLCGIIDLAWEMDEIVDEWCELEAAKLAAAAEELPEYLRERLGEAQARKAAA
jgi:hypothetical protein